MMDTAATTYYTVQRVKLSTTQSNREVERSEYKQLNKGFPDLEHALRGNKESIADSNSELSSPHVALIAPRLPGIFPLGKDTSAVADGSDTSPDAAGSDTPSAAEGMQASPDADGMDTPPDADGSVTLPVADGSETSPVIDGRVALPVADGKDKDPLASGEATDTDSSTPGT